MADQFENLKLVEAMKWAGYSNSQIIEFEQKADELERAEMALGLEESLGLKITDA